MLHGKRVILGISGGIAAYKGPALVRALVEAGAEVRVILTRSAVEFVAPLALQAVSHNAVGLDLFDPAYEAQIGHIELARWADAVLVAPTTANLLARLAYGLCDDLLTTVLCATRAPVVLAPAMNSQMLAHPAVQANLALLAAREGHLIVQPDQGALACQEIGPGRMPDPEVLIAALAGALSPRRLEGRRALITAGPTREAIDPVRFLSNPSSGKMGFAVARAAALLGARVTLVAGPVSLPDPVGVERIDVVSAEEMFEAVMARVQHPDPDQRPEVVVKAAAVADWRPAQVADHKVKKTEGEQLTLVMERTRDIRAGLGALPDDRRPILVGFAAETRDLDRYALDKLNRKNLDMIVANQVSGPTSAFGADLNAVTLFDRQGGRVDLGPAPKDEIAAGIWGHLLAISPQLGARSRPE